MTGRVDVNARTIRCYRCFEMVSIGNGAYALHLREDCQGFPCPCGVFFKMLKDLTEHHQQCDGRPQPQTVLWEAV